MSNKISAGTFVLGTQLTYLKCRQPEKKSETNYWLPEMGGVGRLGEIDEGA